MNMDPVLWILPILLLAFHIFIQFSGKIVIFPANDSGNSWGITKKDHPLLYQSVMIFECCLLLFLLLNYNYRQFIDLDSDGKITIAILIVIFIGIASLLMYLKNRYLPKTEEDDIRTESVFVKEKKVDVTKLIIIGIIVIVTVIILVVKLFFN